MITLQWFGHSCFKISSNGYSIVIDPYSDGSVPGLVNLHLSANRVICSHSHRDHNACENIEIVNNVVSDPFRITQLQSYHDNVKGKQRGNNTINILEADGIRIAHLGDIGCMPESEQLKILSGLDAVMIPIGGFYTLEPDDCRKLLEIINPKNTVVMHYKGEDFGYPVLHTLKDFINKTDNVVYRDILNIKKGSEKQITVMKLL